MLASIACILLLAIIVPCLGRFRGARSGWALAVIPLSAFIYFLGQIPGIIEGPPVRDGFAWVPELGINLSFYLDGLSLLFALIITGIGFLVVVYTGGYLAGNRRLNLFYAYLFFFMGSMLGTVLADNALTLFVFWEMTSISSYLLIGFNHEKSRSRTAALQALLVTGTGGLALLAGLLLLGGIGGTFEISRLSANGFELSRHELYLPILILVLLGAFTKSAQFPFHFWLPNAMEAPTPVSTYLHSATMVKAGIYLIARLSPILGNTDIWIFLLAAVGSVTALLGAWLAFQAADLKRILAYSTVSVLGTLTLLLGLGTDIAVQAAMVLLLAHALYKGTLFLVAGSIDHETGHRDIRLLGGLKSAMPLTMSASAAAAVSMAGILPAFGFIGKELYYEAAGHAGAAYGFVALVSSMLLVAVSGMLCIKPFLGPGREKLGHVQEAPLPLWAPPVVLGFLGLAFGILPKSIDLLIFAGTKAVSADASVIPLGLWHGFNLTLLLSLMTLLGGGTLYILRSRLQTPDRLKAALAPFSMERLYSRALEALNTVSRIQTNILQNGYLRIYLLTIFGTTLLLIWAALDFRLPHFEAGYPDIRFHEAVLAVTVLIGALMSVRSQSRLASVVGLGVVGFGVATLFALMSAPDLAMTQFVIETLTVILLVLVFYRLPSFKTFSTKRARWRDASVALAIGATVTSLLLFASTIRSHNPVSDYFVRHSLSDGHGRNVVNVILVDFRALDTLGEITVLAIAAIGVYALLKLRLSPGDNPPDLRHAAGGGAPVDANQKNAANRRVKRGGPQPSGLTTSTPSNTRRDIQA